MVGVSGRKIPGIRAHMQRCIGDVYATRRAANPSHPPTPKNFGPLPDIQTGLSVSARSFVA